MGSGGIFSKPILKDRVNCLSQQVVKIGFEKIHSIQRLHPPSRRGWPLKKLPAGRQGTTALTTKYRSNKWY
jgi:hypothetical protein